MMKVFSECCKNCLLSPDRIVSPKVANGIVKKCVQEQSHFICHKASMEGKDIMCHTFYEKFGHYSQLLRIMERLGCVEFVEQSESKKLMTHTEMDKIGKKS